MTIIEWLYFDSVSAESFFYLVVRGYSDIFLQKFSRIDSFYKNVI